LGPRLRKVCRQSAQEILLRANDFGEFPLNRKTTCTCLEIETSPLAR
jgi:hypothetical protein